MKNEEIVTALRCCASIDGSGCGICPSEELDGKEICCGDALKLSAADLIENQRNHIRALMQANDALRRGEALEDRPNVKVLCTMNADRLRELAEADREGRVVVLPCKVGDTVWIAGSVRGVYSATVRTFFCGHPSAVRGADDDGYIQMIRTTECDIPIRSFGKTAFFTREEAEEALRRAEDGNC